MVNFYFHGNVTNFISKTLKWSCRLMNAKEFFQEIKGNQEGELQFCGDLDMANIVAHFSNLTVVSSQINHGSVYHSLIL